MESKNFYLEKFKGAKGFVNIKFLKNILDKEFIDVFSEWQNKEDFFDFVKNVQKGEVPKFSMPAEYLERFLYESID